jgi:hypothetical protein
VQLAHGAVAASAGLPGGGASWLSVVVPVNHVRLSIQDQNDKQSMEEIVLSAWYQLCNAWRTEGLLPRQNVASVRLLFWL